jgi:Sulfotransferase family
MMSKRRRRSPRTILVVAIACSVLVGIMAALQWSLVQRVPVATEVPPPPPQRTTTISDKAVTRLPLVPKMQPHGGFILFLHVPKTGGTTIRDALMKYDQVQYHFVSGRKLFDKAHINAMKYLSMVSSSSSNNKNNDKKRRKTFFLEIHGRDSPHLLELVGTIQIYRRMAQEHDIPIFIFSMLREPISYALSYFNFFHVQRGPNPYFPQVEPTETNLLEYSLYNPQCQFLARGEMSLRQRRRKGVDNKPMPSIEECQLVQDALRNHMDWVGTTEQLNESTLPILRQVLVVGDDPSSSHLSFPTKRVSRHGRNESLALADLSFSTLAALQNMSRLDQELYHNIQSTFPLRRNG